MGKRTEASLDDSLCREASDQVKFHKNKLAMKQSVALPLKNVNVLPTCPTFELLSL